MSLVLSYKYKKFDYYTFVKDNSNIVPIWPNIDDYIQTYEENIYDNCSYSYSLSEILKKWWKMYKNVEMNNLKYMYDKYGVSKKAYVSTSVDFDSLRFVSILSRG